MDEIKDLDPKLLAVVYSVTFFVTALVVKRIANCCLHAQRSKLRDEYEDELRRGGKLTNRLLLPVAQRTAWDPYGHNVRAS